MRNDIKFDITDTCSTINTDNEAITICLKNTQCQISISTIYIPPMANIPTLTVQKRIDGVWHWKKPTHRDSRTNSSDIIDYVISSPANVNKIQNLTLNNDLSSDHSTILFDFLTNLKKSIIPPIKVKLRFERYFSHHWAT